MHMFEVVHVAQICRMMMASAHPLFIWAFFIIPVARVNLYCLTWVGRVLKGDDVALFERLAVQQIGPILRLAVKENPINNTSVL